MKGLLNLSVVCIYMRYFIPEPCSNTVCGMSLHALSRCSSLFLFHFLSPHRFSNIKYFPRHKTVVLPWFWLLLHFGIEAVIFGHILYCIFSAFCCFYPNREVFQLHISKKESWRSNRLKIKFRSLPAHPHANGQSGEVLSLTKRLRSLTSKQYCCILLNNGCRWGLALKPLKKSTRWTPTAWLGFNLILRRPKHIIHAFLSLNLHLRYSTNELKLFPTYHHSEGE